MREMYTVPRGRPAAVQSGTRIRRGLATLPDLEKIDELTETMRLTALCGLGHFDRSSGADEYPELPKGISGAH